MTPEILESIFNTELLKNTSFVEIVQQVRQEAEENGLTPEILEELLPDE